MAVTGGYAYVATREGGLAVFDVSTPSSPVEVCQRHGGTAYMLPSWYCILAGMGRFAPADKAPWPEMLAAAEDARGMCRTQADRFEDHAQVLHSYR